MMSAIQLAYDPNNIRPGWIAFVVVVSLCVATFFLWRSMNTQLRKIQIPPAGGSTSDAGEPDGVASLDDDPDTSATDSGDQPDSA